MKFHLELNFPVISVVILLLFSEISFSQQSISSPHGNNVTLRTFNFCQYHADLIICNGDSIQSPSIGWGGCQTGRFYHKLDSITILDSIYYFDIDHNSSYPTRPEVFCVGNENTVLSFTFHYEFAGFCDTPSITPVDTLILDSIAGVTVGVFNTAVIRKSASTNNFFVYDSSLFNLSYSMQLDMVPLFVESNAPGIYVLGLDSGNYVRLNVFDNDLQMLIKDTLFSYQYSDLIAMKAEYNRIYFVCQPGDSLVKIVSYDIFTGAFNENIVYNGSGVNTGVWNEYYYIFQPFSDPSGNNQHLEVISVYLNNFQQSISNNITTRLDKILITNTDFSIDGILNLRYANDPDKLYVYDIAMDTLETDPYPVFAVSDLRCTIGIDEYDDSKLDWIAFPNPSGEEINIAAAGLICGKDYKIDIVDLQGNILFNTTVQAKMQITLPMSGFSPGVYFVRIHSLKGLVAKKIVKL